MAKILATELLNKLNINLEEIKNDLRWETAKQFTTEGKFIVNIKEIKSFMFNGTKPLNMVMLVTYNKEEYKINISPLFLEASDFNIKHFDTFQIKVFNSFIKVMMYTLNNIDLLSEIEIPEKGEEKHIDFCKSYVNAFLKVIEPALLNRDIKINVKKKDEFFNTYLLPYVK